ncbi:MAG: MarR family transcriptional regulator [Lachnospiraceae bacterium]|nr:MarR family transcriptional regulator [Lachnospiraceae bacterium]
MGEKQHQIVNLFRVADRILKRSIDKKVEGTGVYRSQHRLLMLLGKFPECSQTEIAEKMEVSPAAVAVSLKKLEKSGYVSRQCNENDNRVNHVAVTEKGWKTIKASINDFIEIENAFFVGFSEEEMEQLEEYLRRIIKNGDIYYQSLLKQEN